MDSDIEIIDDISEDYHPEDSINDFSQVRIEVHGADVAERILGDLTNDKKEQLNGCAEIQQCPESQSDIVLLEDTPEPEPGIYVDLPESDSNYFVNESETFNLDEDVTENVEPNKYLDKVIEPILDSNADKPSEDYSEKDDCNYIDEVSEPEIESQETQGTESVVEDADTEITEHIHDLSFEDVTIKEEVEEFDDMDFADFEDVNTEICNDILPPEDIYHFNNKIILGTKPCQKLANVNSEANNDKCLKEYMDTEVILENWGEYLEKSTCFCKKCDILFATPNGLDSHNMSTHSFLVAVSNNKAVKSTTKPAFARKSTCTRSVPVKTNSIAKKSTSSNNIMVSKLCNHCNKVFPNNTDLIKHLYELLPFNKDFSCKICKASFKTQKELISHNSVHVKIEKKVKKENIVKERADFKKKLLYEEDLKQKHPVSPKKELNVIPMATLFQCTKCNTHFLNSFSGIQHDASCKPGSVSVRRIVTCKTCKRKLRDIDSVLHKKQHQMCTKFKIYKITKTIFERTLCRCPKCGVHFNDITIKTHLKNCGKILTGHCQKCNILIPKSKLYGHLVIHKKQNLKPKDFIIVPYFIQNKAQKRKLEPMVAPAKKIKMENNKMKKKPNANIKIKIKNSHKVIASKIKKEPVYIKKENGTRKRMVDGLKFEIGKRKIYFCRHCQKCSLICRQGLHLTKQCMNQPAGDKTVCEECGLFFCRKNMNAHKKLHNIKKLTIHDMAFYSILTLKRTLPTMPSYVHCENCNIKFLNNKGKKKHICGENYKTCKVCGDKFDISAYKLHIEFHKLIKNQPQKQKTETKMMPELLKKYESFNMMWNLLYSCKTCDTVIDSYDKVVDHSQAHHKNEASSKNIKCYICNLKFDESCWSKHSDLHSRMNINSKDFKILSYDPKKLLLDEWFELFSSLPEEQIRQITDKSLYGYERGIKMMLLKDGRSEFTLHCCSNCNVCYGSNEIAQHVSSACRRPANLCKICNIPFNDVNALRFHELLHLKGIKKEEFRIVKFIKSKTMLRDELPLTGVFVLQQCTRCNVCIRHACNSHRHMCVVESVTVKCPICLLVFNRMSLQRHIKEHEMNPNFNRNNIQVELFDPLKSKYNVKRKYNKDNSKMTKPAKVPKTYSKQAKSDASKTINETPKSDIKTAKVFKCECGLHYTSPKTIEKHMETCSADSDISTENCSKCGLLFPTDILVSHLCKHHSKNTKIVIELYKQNKEEPESRFESVESTSENSTPKRIKSTKAAEFAPNPKTNNQVKLYKCGPCNVFYLAQNSCYKHIYKDHKPLDPKQYIECKLCGLQFTINSLKIHLERHHQNELNLDNVLVEEYEPRYGMGSPKIHIYMASEKLQSLQVTSSIEESKVSHS